ncbi:hypothetical protein HZ989_09450 [Brevundimonas sp. AJA228-03]|uniref:hypothetical protein n=1 Tax=Brevundimonas sp. AJA228-03 TaxID=2752515 RepID=UPI001AE028FC|nr:hypothetical protein [Brevundimonas sp. AJA228-03]QTN18498.1 hypothetical protein HZ989_09450 [Brevundimonas sp. AJA228-03]
MSAFEFFFSFYGLLLGLSVAAIATGLALAIQNRRTMRIGYLTPLLATFVALDIASFWDFAWTVLRDAPFSYGLLVMGLIVALVYFVAASLVFPYAATEGQSLDDHFWANKRTVLLLTTVANTLALCLALPFVLAAPDGAVLAFGYGFNLLLYVLLILPAALAKRPRLFVILTTLHIGLYLAIAVTSVLAPSLMTMPESTPPAAAG